MEIRRKTDKIVQNQNVQRITVEDQHVSRTHVTIQIKDNKYLLINNKSKEQILFRQHLQQDYQILEPENDALLDAKNIEIKLRKKGFYIIRLQCYQPSIQKIESFTELTQYSTDSEQSETPQIQDNEIKQDKQQEVQKQNKQETKQTKRNNKQKQKDEEISSDESENELEEISDYSTQNENLQDQTQSINISIDASGLQYSQISKKSEKLESMSSQTGIIIPKIIKENQDYSQVVQQAVDLYKSNVFVQNELTQELQNLFEKMDVEILYNLKDIRQGSCLFASSVSRSAKYLCCLIVGLPIFEYKNIQSQNSQQTFKLQLLQPTVQQIRQLFKDDRDFKIEQFNQVQLSQNYFVQRLNAQQRILILTEESLDLQFDKDDDNPNTFGFIIYLTLLNFQVFVLINKTNQTQKEYILNSKLKYKHVNIIYSDDYIQQIQRIIKKNSKSQQLKPLFLYTNNYNIEQDLQQLDIQFVRKVKLIETAFLGKFAFDQ